MNRSAVRNVLWTTGMETRVTNESSSDGWGSIVHDVTTVLRQEGNVDVVFGKPVKLDTCTIIPVATVSLGGGGGGLLRLGPTVDVIRRWIRRSVSPGSRIGGGGGWGIDVRPVGFLSEVGGHVVFTSIDDGKPKAAP